MEHAVKDKFSYYAIKIIVYLLIAVMTVISLLPFVWMFFSAFKSNLEVFTIPVQWLPKVWHPENFVVIWKRVALLTFFKNSAKLTVIITLLQLVTSSFAAYAFAKMEFTGRDFLFLAYIGTIAIPWQVYMVPQFIMMRSLGLSNTHMALILLQAFSATGVFMIRQFFITIPNELSEAARIDGLNEYGIYFRIMLPLSKPAMATLTIFTAVFVWNDFMGPFIYINDTGLKTIQLGLRLFIQQYSADYAYIMAASLISLLPVMIVFISMQRFFIEGVATSGLKG